MLLSEGVLDEIQGGVDEPEDRHLSEGTLLIDGVHHSDVERGRFVEAADGMVKEDISVLEEPGDHDQG